MGEDDGGRNSLGSERASRFLMRACQPSRLFEFWLYDGQTLWPMQFESNWCPELKGPKLTESFFWSK